MLGTPNTSENTVRLMNRIPVLEIFGPTVQGEGMVIGQKTMFVRTAGCDYQCSWCDSAFTWDGSAKNMIKMMQPHEIWAELQRIGGDRFAHVTLSGGNPALLPHMKGLISLLHEKGIVIAVETQGSRWQDWLIDIDQVTLSPKPPSSGMSTNRDILDDIIARLLQREAHYSMNHSMSHSVSDFMSNASSRSLSLKVVIFDEVDLTFAKEIHQRYPQVPMFLQVGNPDVQRMDIHHHASELLSRYEELIDLLMSSNELNDVRVLPQLHALVWGNKRGV